MPTRYCGILIYLLATVTNDGAYVGRRSISTGVPSDLHVWGTPDSRYNNIKNPERIGAESCD